MFNFGRHRLYIEEKYEKYADFKGASEEEEQAARIAAHMKHIHGHGSSGAQGSCSRITRTLRHAKYPSRVGAVRIK